MPTWNDVKDDPKLEAFTININAFDTQTYKDWVKNQIEDWHWDRLRTIAETSEETLRLNPGLGFSWVPLVVIDGQITRLETPAHIENALTAA